MPALLSQTAGQLQSAGSLLMESREWLHLTPDLGLRELRRNQRNASNERGLLDERAGGNCHIARSDFMGADVFRKPRVIFIL